jgi:transposase InsO family protein
MSAADVSNMLEDTLRFTALDQVKGKYRLRLLSDNDPSYIAGDLATWLKGSGMQHTRGKPYHPQTPGKNERWHRSSKNRICWITNICRGNSKRKSASSSIIAITSVT